MIQIKRGKTENWRKAKNILKSGQPGYDKDKHKIKIGDGVTSWKELPYASGLFEEEILDSEENAKHRLSEDSENVALFTYGIKDPNKDTVGKVYLQQYDTEPEVDYIVDFGRNGDWFYQKWHSGIAKCWCTITYDNIAIDENLNGLGLYCNSTVENSNKLGDVNYPFTFVTDKDEKKEEPTETATLQSDNITWIASRNKNTSEKSGAYVIISHTKQQNAKYKLSLTVTGYWR